MDPRLNRLRNDYDKMQELAARSPFVTIEATEGYPAEKYVLLLTCKGITDLDSSGRPMYSESHRLGIHLHDEYPRKAPVFQMITSVYHPNIAKNGLVCIGDEGDHGYAPSMGLDDLVVRIIEIIRYENMGLNSAFNLLAANWAGQNQNLFPLDTRQIVGEALIEIDILDEISFIDPVSDGDDLDIKIF